ncbi:MAG: 30S ribosome-binding factor RbfA [Longimicrobiales bacterium]
MAGRRLDRLNEQVKREVADILHSKVKDPRIGPVTVTDARVARDLSLATVYVLRSGTEEEQQDTLAGLKAAAPYIRNELGQRLRLRKLPSVRFLRDQMLEQAQRIEQLLHDVRQPAPIESEHERDED